MPKTIIRTPDVPLPIPMLDVDFAMPSAWRGHQRFVSYLISLLRPKVIYELGVHHGFSLRPKPSPSQHQNSSLLPAWRVLRVHRSSRRHPWPNLTSWAGRISAPRPSGQSRVRRPKDPSNQLACRKLFGTVFESLRKPL